MAIDPDAVGAESGEGTARWVSTDCLLYALAVGAGAQDPADPSELPFTTESTIGGEQRVLPTFPLAVQVGDSPLDALGDFDRTMMVNGEQELTLYQVLPIEGWVRGRSRIVGVYDRGSGALVIVEDEATDASTGAPVWTTRTSILIRGEGGWGGDRGPSCVRWSSERPPDQVVTYQTRPEQALLYRLSGDRHSIHSDPGVACSAGFHRPILHGRATLGFAGRALLHTLCDSNPARLRSIRGRFTRPVVPGEALTVSIWVLEHGEAVFRTTASDGVVVLDQGRCAYET